MEIRIKNPTTMYTPSTILCKVYEYVTNRVISLVVYYILNLISTCHFATVLWSECVGNIATLSRFHSYLLPQALTNLKIK